MKLEHRTVLITGGSSGIGLELARQLVARRNTVIGPAAIGKGLTPPRRLCRVSIRSRATSVIRQTFSHYTGAVLFSFPALDTLINNAGIMPNLKLTEERDLEDVIREIEVDLIGPVRMVQQLLLHLIGRPGSLIINVSSGLAFVPFPIAPVYCAAKAGIHSFTQSLRVQLSDQDVTVVELTPPGVETPLFRGEFADETRGQKPMSARVLAERAIAGIESGKLRMRPGVANVLNAMSRIAPRFMLKQMANASKPKSAPALALAPS